MNWKILLALAVVIFAGTGDYIEHSTWASGKASPPFVYAKLDSAAAPGIKSIVHDSLTVERHFDTLTARAIIHDSLTVERHFDTLTARAIIHDSLSALTPGRIGALPVTSSPVTAANFGDATTAYSQAVSANDRGLAMQDSRALNWRGGMFCTDTYWGFSQDASLSSSFKPFVLADGTGSVWFKNDPLATIKNTLNGGTSITGTVNLPSVTASRLLKTDTSSHVVPAIAGTDYVSPSGLTTALGNYLPLAGGTLTGALSGTSATFSGDISGAYLHTATDNTRIGRFAGNPSMTGAYNTLSGLLSGYSISTGSGNSCFGQSSGLSNKTGSGNTYIGYASGTNDSIGNNNVFIGYYAGVTQGSVSNTIIIDGYGDRTSAALELTNAPIVATTNSVPTSQTVNLNAAVSITGGSTAHAALHLNSQSAPTTPANGDVWFDGTNLKIQIGGVTKTITTL
jgi:hypothetical protein